MLYQKHNTPSQGITRRTNLVFRNLSCAELAKRYLQLTKFVDEARAKCEVKSIKRLKFTNPSQNVRQPRG